MNKLQLFLTDKKYTTTIVVVFATSVFVCYTFYSLLGVAVLSSDDLTLFNPVYEYLKTGHLNYPVHGIQGIITVHPPVQYYWVAFAIKAGLNSQQAYVIPFLTALFLVLLTTVSTSLPNTVKLSAIYALQVLYFFPVTSIRPDCALALFWFLGLLWFWWAAKKNFPVWLLFGAGFFTAISSTLHYYAIFNNVAAVVFLYALHRGVHREQFMMKALWLLLGFVVVLVPYFTCFVCPHINEILYFVKVNQSAPNAVSCISRHLQFYSPFAVYIQSFFFLSASLTAAYAAYAGFVPLALVAFVLLLFKKETRTTAFAAAPLTFMVLFFSRGKTEGYFMPEFLLFVFAINYLLLSWCRKNGSLLKILLTFWTAGGLIVSVTFVLLHVETPLRLQKHSMHTVRWASQQVVGSSAHIGGRISAWYISGGRNWTDITYPVTTMEETPTPDSLRAFFKRFDALAETKHMAGVTKNRVNSTLGTLYLDSTLQLKGFIFSENGGYESELATLFFSASQIDSVKGFVCRNNGDVYEANENPEGSYVFMSFKTPVQAGLLDSIAVFAGELVAVNYFPLPNASGGSSYFHNKGSTHYLAFVLIKQDDYESAEGFFAKTFQVRDVVRCTLHQVDTSVIQPATKVSSYKIL